MFFVALLSLGFTACSENNEEDSIIGGGGGADPEGTIVVNIRNRNSVNSYYDSGAYAELNGIYTRIYDNNEVYNGSEQLRIDEADNLYADHCNIVCIGKVNGLGDIRKIPQSGWAKKALVVPGYGYIVERWKEDNYIPHCARIYVVDYMLDTSGGIIGATIKYQSPWGA